MCLPLSLSSWYGDPSYRTDLDWRMVGFSRSLSLLGLWPSVGDLEWKEGG